MMKRFCRVLSLVAVLLLLTCQAGTAWAQGGTRGTVSVTVTDPGGLVVAGAKLTLVDLKTKDARSASSLENGSYTFTGLLGGTYSLTATKDGFETKKFDAVLVEAARTTDLKVKLAIGAITTQVDVVAEATPLVETSSSAIGTNFDIKAIEDLPGGRDVSQLAKLVPGSSGGIFNGMRGAAESTSMDGAIANSSRFKDYTTTSVVVPRLENVDEIVVQTDQLDLNQGYGQSNMATIYNTRRGGASYHGRVYGDIANSALNTYGFATDFNIFQEVASHQLTHSQAVSKANENRTNHSLTWGPSVGGPIPIPGYKDRLFFFASYTQKGNPGNTTITSEFPALGTALVSGSTSKQSNLQAGMYTYLDTNGTLQSVNLFSQAAALNSLTPGLNLPVKVNTTILSELNNINNSLTSSATVVSDGGDKYNVTDVKFGYPANNTHYYPTFRVDYNATKDLRFNLAFNESKTDSPYAGQPPYPGSTYDAEKSSHKTEYYTAAFGSEWTINSRFLNQFHGGYLYYFEGNLTKTGNQYAGQDLVYWNSAEQLTGSGQTHASPQSNLYPLATYSDNLVWSHGAHNVMVGGSGYREQDHYWNPTLGWHAYFLGSLVGGDPAINAFQSTASSSAPGLINASYQQTQVAQAFYGILTGRLDGYWNPYALDAAKGTFTAATISLDEVQQAFGLYAQDSWRIKPSLTVNYGIRWDFTGDDHDIHSMYHTVSPQDLWGPSGYMNQFNPGSFKNPNATPSFNAQSHAYAPWHVSPQPSIGLAWNPTGKDGILGHLLGGSSTVIRAGYAFRNYTEGYQNFWNYASNQGSFFGNNYYSNPQDPAGGPQPYGTFAPGSLSLGTPVPASVIGVDYSTYQKNVAESSLTFKGIPNPEGIDPKIRQPYVQSWNLGIQRQLGRNNAIEIRYVGNHGSREWIPINPNEVNVFENGFLMEFQLAQKNLNASIAANPNCVNQGTCSFKGSGTGMPIMAAAFGGDLSQWSNGGFISNLQNGQVGDFASALTQQAYFCNLASNFTSECVGNAGLTGTGNGPYPSNVFQANPYASGQNVGYLTSEGSSNYHSLQVEFRQKNYHGANFSANYTFAKNLGVRPVIGGDSSNFSLITLRNWRLANSPSDTDVRQTFNLLGTFDLPFGKGKAFLANNKFVNVVVGNWTVGTISTFKTGLPFLLTGGNHTFNNFTDGGINMTGVTLKQLRKSVGVYHNWSNGNISFINPKYQSAAYLTPNTTPGTLGQRPWLWGPHAFSSDMSVSKVVPIREGIKFSLQTEITNVFNHSTWGLGLPYTTSSLTNPSVTSVSAIHGGFAQSSAVSGGRGITFRTNIEF